MSGNDHIFAEGAIPDEGDINGAASMNAAKTHCKRGHEFTPENTYRSKEGRRRCKTCERSRKSPKPRNGGLFGPI